MSGSYDNSSNNLSSGTWVRTMMNDGWTASDVTQEQIAWASETRRVYNQHARTSRVATDRIGGMDSLMTSVWNSITFPLERPESCDVRVTKGLILHGPKGVGKKILMEALAERCSHYNPQIASFYFKSAIDMGNHVENNLVQLFNLAKQQRPSVIFLSDFHRIAAYRGPYVRTLQALMDELDDNGSVFVVAATKHLDKVDPEIRKEGRFDTEILIKLPNLEARKEILQKACVSWQFRSSVLDEVARETSGFTGSDLCAVLFAAFKSARDKLYPTFHLFPLNCDLTIVRLEMNDFKEALLAVQSAKQPQQNII